MVRKIFSPVIKLWNWIRQTAWIQPLLIVGIVFGIIFSISPIVQCASNIKSESEYDFYKNKRQSLEKVFNDYENCDAANLLSNIYTADSLLSDKGKGYNHAETQAAINKLPAKKFFLMFYSEECDACKSSSEAYKYLETNWGKDYFTTDEEFKMYTIDTLQKATNDEKNEEEVAFLELLDQTPEFFETSAGKIDQYSISNRKGYISSTELKNLEQVSKEAFPVPTLYLIDFTNPEAETGFRDLMFTVKGKNGKDQSGDKAMYLFDFWSGKGDFEDK